MMELLLVLEGLVVAAISLRNGEDARRVQDPEFPRQVSPLAINFRKTRTDKPGGSAEHKSNFQSQMHPAPGIQIRHDETRHPGNLQHAIEVNGLRELFQQALRYERRIHCLSLSGPGMSKMICAGSSS